MCDRREAEIIASTQRRDLCSLYRHLCPLSPLSCVLTPSDPEISTLEHIYSDDSIMKDSSPQ